jgi:hypothetical protein
VKDRCCCPQCYGLREFMLDATGQDYGLPPAPGHTALRPVVALAGVTIGEQCTGRYDCSCTRCSEQRAVLVRTPHSRDKRQPWQPIPATERRAA